VPLWPVIGAAPAMWPASSSCGQPAAAIGAEPALWAASRVPRPVIAALAAVSSARVF
jgi:hypothetical protein